MQTNDPGPPDEPSATPPIPPPPPPAPPAGLGAFAPPPPAYTPPPAYAPTPTVAQEGPAPGMVYGGFWIRFGAYVVDAIIIGAVYLIGVHFIVTRYTDELGNTLYYDNGWWLNYGALIILLVYFGLCWPLLGGSLGQRLFRLEVLREADGRRLTAGDTVLRLVGWIISSIPIGIGFVVAAFDARKQGWHDKIAHTLVVRRTA